MPLLVKLQWGRSLGSCGNYEGRDGRRIRIVSFNGAAALGAAETWRRPPAPTRPSKLQWGRSLGSCGNADIKFYLSTDAGLQWGRSLGSCGNAAPQRCQGPPCHSFNGAAALGAAETDPLGQRPRKGDRASMGPQPWELRKHLLLMGASPLWQASMGPQPWELRKQTLISSWRSEPSSLQWGRSLGSCGNWTRAVAAWGYPLLQWGRSLGSCGNEVDEAVPGRRRESFNGAAALGAAETASVHHA